MRVFRRRGVACARLPALALGAVLSLPAAALLAQELPAGPGAVTRLGDLYARVERDNPKLSAARALAHAAEARVPGVTHPPDPQLQLGFMNYTLPGFSPMPLVGMTQLQVMQMVPLGGKLGLAGRAARARAAAVDERVQDVAWDLHRQTAMAFYDLYATDRQLAVARETLRLLQDIMRTAEAMYRVGEGRQADVLRAQVEIARMTEDTLRMRATREAMVARLDALLDRDASGDLPTPVLPRFPDSIPSRAWLDSVATGGRPMIRARVEEVHAADASASLARREIIPDLQVGVQYAWQRATMTSPDGSGAATMASKTEHMGSLMIGVSVPIFAGARQLRMRTEADAMRAMAEADLAATRADTRGRIGEAYAALVRARHLTRLYRGTVLPEAEATAQSALSAYRVGTVDFMTLLDDRMTVNNYRQELAGLEADEGKAWAELETLTGRELFDPVDVTIAAGARTDTVGNPTRGIR